MLGGRYTLLEPIGHGGMAVVWRARDEVLGRTVAVKLLAGRYADDAESRARIRAEARAAAALSHPHIAQVYDYGEADEDGLRVPYVVMELVHGITLQQRARTGVLDPREICRIGAQVAAALAAAHADGLVHRDIKPANVMVTRDGVKVVDFGLAASAGAAEPEELLGTPAYLAPERMTSDAVEPASDVYALGVLLYRLLAGESPWTVDSTTQMLTAHVKVDPVPLPHLPGVPAEITALINRCLRKEPAGRPSAAEVARVLGGGAVLRTGTPPPLPAPPSRRGKLLAGTAATLALLAVAGWMLLPSGPPPASELPAAISAPPAGDPVPTSASAPGGTTAPGLRPGATSATMPRRPTTAPADRATSPTTEPAGRPSASESPAGLPDGVATFRSAGGTVAARCTLLGLARIVGFAPASPYKVERVNPGPALAAVIVFRDGGSRIRMTLSCVAGVPVAVVTT
ncbi:putative serine/threonine-protein kinase PknA [Couchioplanes caeruleus subsp. azureus]|nr:putative serine/threonine-protein kinase PknA [Couchioplanes caeruleus subsp. azureus]